MGKKSLWAGVLTALILIIFTRDVSTVPIRSGEHVAAIHARGCRVKQAVVGDLDGVPHAVVLTSDPHNAVRLYRLSDAKSVEVWRGIPGKWKPWKVQIADVDGDGQKEIGVGVYKTARFHPVPAKRPFIYGWDGQRLYPKWLGSRLSRPFTDFALVEFESGPRLVSVEQARDGMQELAVYRWDGFGFTREWTGVRSKSISSVTAVNGRVKVLISGTSREYDWNANKLIER